MLRIGSGGGPVDNIHAGGISVGVDNDGLCMKTAYRLGYGDHDETFTEHPDTHIKFDGYRIPMMRFIHDSVKSLHARTPNIGIISWDLSINDSNEVIIVEANYTGQGVWFPQITMEKSLFDGCVPEMLSMLNKQKVKAERRA